MAKHAIVHVEFSANDPVTAAKFYQELFGWNILQMPGMDYWGFEGSPGGGFPKADGQNTLAGSTVVSVSTDDIEASLAKAASLGASTLVPKTEIPSVGWFAVFVDPTGNRVGLYTGLPGQG